MDWSRRYSMNKLYHVRLQQGGEWGFRGQGCQDQIMNAEKLLQNQQLHWTPVEDSRPWEECL